MLSSGPPPSAAELAEQSAQQAQAEAVLLVLRTRGFVVPPELEQRIHACADPEVLARWLQRAVTAPSAAEALVG